MKTERQPIIKRGVADTARPHASLPTVCAACVEERDHLEAIKRQHDAERESWAKEKALMARQHSAEVKRGNDLERQLALATNRKGGDAEEMTAVKKRLFAANAEAKKTEARFNAQESRHRLELREKEVAMLKKMNEAVRRTSEAEARAVEAEGRIAAAEARGAEVIHLSGKRARTAFGDCQASQIVVLSVMADPPLRGGCKIFDPERLRGTGSVVLKINKGQVTMQTARQKAGARLWTAWRSKEEK